MLKYLLIAVVICLYCGFLAGWQFGLGLACILLGYPLIYFIYCREKDPEQDYPMNKWKY